MSGSLDGMLRAADAGMQRCPGLRAVAPATATHQGGHTLSEHASVFCCQLGKAVNA